MNILIVKLSAIGDVVHTLPSLEAVRELYPHAHITWVIEETSADLVTGHPTLDRILISRRKHWLRNVRRFRAWRQTFRDMRQFLSALRERHYDIVIDFHGLFKSAVIVLLCRGKRKIGYRSMQELSGLVLTEKIPEDMGKHAVDRYLDFPRYLGWRGGDVRFRIPVDNEVEASVRRLLHDNEVDIEAPFVAVSPRALWPTKLWDDGRFARLCERIVTDLSLPVLLTGADRDGSLARIADTVHCPVVNLGGRTSLKELAYLFSRATAVVTTDSGPMHIAAAMGTPTVALFGPTDPSRTGPYGRGHRVIRAGVVCSPCFLKRCDHRYCMDNITVDTVFDAVAGILAGGEREKA